MINDRDIDLTVEAKFGLHWEHNKHYSNTRLKLGGRRNSDLWVMQFFKNRKHEIPWIKKERELSSLTRKCIRTKRDEISDEFGATVRSTSSNTFLIFTIDTDYYHRKDVLDDFFLECVGYIPFTAITRCFRCGTPLMHSLRDKSIPWHCNHCQIYSGTDNGLPWRKA